MPLFDALIHAVNFAAPAAFLAVLMPLLAKLMMPRRSTMLAGWAQVLINFAVCLALLLLGLVFFGRDGKMATYALLVLGAATTQWMLVRGWQKS